MAELITIERPENGYFLYIRGEKPRYKVGDNIAYYEFYDDYEGEEPLGKVTSVKFDEDIDDWVYEFEDGYWCPEEELVSNEAYIKREKK